MFQKLRKVLFYIVEVARVLPQNIKLEKAL